MAFWAKIIIKKVHDFTLMSKRKKRLEKIRQNPKTIRIKELDFVLRDFGFSPDFTVGLHTTYRHKNGLPLLYMDNNI